MGDKCQLERQIRGTKEADNIAVHEGEQRGDKIVVDLVPYMCEVHGEVIGTKKRASSVETMGVWISSC